MSILLHAASPASALLLSAALHGGQVDATRPRVLVLDSSTPGGAALERGWGDGLWAGLAQARVDLAAAAPHTVGTPTLLVLDPSQPAEASALAAAWPHASVLVFGDGLGVLSPTPAGLDAGVGRRATELLHSALLPGLRPLHFMESGVPTRALEWSCVKSALEPLMARAALPGAAAHALKGKGRACLAVLQGLPDLGKASQAESERLATRIVRAAQDGGTSALLLAPDASISPAAVARVETLATQAGLRVGVLPTSWPAELAHALVGPRLTVGVSAPALFSVQRLFGARVRSVATGRLLPRLHSAEDPARVVLAVVDATLRRGVSAPAEELSDAASDAGSAGGAADSRLQSILDAVGYSVAPQLLAPLRDRTARTLRREPALRDAYISRKRVKKLHLLDAAVPQVPALPAATSPLAALLPLAARSGRTVR